MPHIAFYQVLTDDVVLPLPNLNPGNDEDQDTQRLTLNPANDIELNATGQHRPLLCYQVNLENADDFKLQVQVRDKQGALRTISTWTFDGNTTRQFVNPFRLEWINSGNNIFFFKRLSGNGGVKIRNVVVFYQRNV